MKTTCPRPRASIPPTRSRVRSIGATRLIATIWSSSSSVRSTYRRLSSIPALLTRMSTSPASRARRWTSSRLTRSASTTSPPSSWASARSASSLRPESTTRAPSAASARASRSPSPPAAPVTSAVRPAISTPSVSHRRKEDHFPDGVAAAEQHHQAVDPHAQPAGRRHPVLERLDEDLVVGLGLLVALGLQADLGLEARALLVGVVELGERVGDLHPAREGLEALDEPGLVAVGLGERRQLDRIVHDDRRLLRVGLDVLGQQVVDQLGPGAVLVGQQLAGRREQRLAVAVLEDVDARLL